nr:putative serine/threonine-protein kinase iks1 [Polyrhizophydium stewartii]
MCGQPVLIPQRQPRAHTHSAPAEPHQQHQGSGQAADGQTQHVSFVDSKYFRLLAELSGAGGGSSAAAGPASAPLDAEASLPFSRMVPLQAGSSRLARRRSASLSQISLVPDNTQADLLARVDPSPSTAQSEPAEYRAGLSPDTLRASKSRSPRITEAALPDGADTEAGHGRDEPVTLDARSFNQGYYDRFFVEERKLGRGQRGSVFLCQHVLDKVPLGQFAVKAIPVGTSHTWLVRMLKEVHLLERLKHPNIIEYKHAWLENRQLTLFGPEVPCLFVLMELANGGNLEEFLRVQWDPLEPELGSAFAPIGLPGSSAARPVAESPADSPQTAGGLSSDRSSSDRIKRTFRAMRAAKRASHNLDLIWPPQSLATHLGSQMAQSSTSNAAIEGGIGVAPDGAKVRFLIEPVIRSLFSDICHGLAHLHRHGIIHRDLKPPNLLLRYADSSRSGIPRILISDFGECEVISDAVERERTGATGTLEFMPPELLRKDHNNQYLSNHSTKADMWSLGVVLYFLCYSSVPYAQVDDVDQLKLDIINFKS